MKETSVTEPRAIHSDLRKPVEKKDRWKAATKNNNFFFQWQLPVKILSRRLTLQMSWGLGEIVTKMWKKHGLAEQG